MPTLDGLSLDRLLADVLQATPVLGELAFEQDGCWLIECPSGSSLWIEWLPAAMALAFTTSLGRPDPVHESAVLNLALASNQRWHGQTALRVARDGTDGDLLLLDQLDITGLTVQALAQALLRFEATRALWEPALRGVAQYRPDLASPSELLNRRA
jgi:hypothetical protein